MDDFLAQATPKDKLQCIKKEQAEARLAAYLKYQASHAVAFSLRFEYNDDASRFTTGVAQ